MKNSKNKILIIGGEGYIGSVVTNFFLKKGIEVDSYDCLLYQNNYHLLSNLYDDNYKFIHGKMSEINSKVKFNNYSTIILLAGLVGDPITKKYHELSLKINENDILNIIDSIKNLDIKFIFSSTCSNYGLRENLNPASEIDKLEPLSTYAKSKVLIEKEIMSLKNESKFSPIIFRFATAFGLSPRMRFDLTVNQFTRELALGRKLKVYDKDTWRPYCHVKDFANILFQAVNLIDIKNLSFEVFNVGIDENNASKYKIIKIINDLLKKDNKVDYIEKSIDKRNYVVDFSKLEKTFDTSKFVTLDEGISEIYEMIKNGLFNDDKNTDLYGNFVLNV